MDKKQKQLFEIFRQHRRREKIRKFIHHSKLVWILDPYPYEIYNLHQRSIVDSNKREWIRQALSWHTIAGLQNEKVYKAGLIGIVIAPILAGLSTIEILSISISFPIQMAFIFVSGILFVLATSCYNIRAPYFVRKYIESEQNKVYKAVPMRELRYSIFQEFLQLGTTVEITPKNINKLRNHKTALIAAGVLLLQGDSCYKVGFDAYGQAIIEKLLYRLAEKHGFKIYEEYDMDDGETGLRERWGPLITYPAEEIYIRHLIISNAKKHFVMALSPKRVTGDLNDNDLVIKFYDPYIATKSQSDKNSQLEPYIDGLENLLNTKYIDTIIEELSYWQSWQRPLSRILSFLLYRLSLLSFVIFLLYQCKVVGEAIFK